jgi:hypothetical protein
MSPPPPQQSPQAAATNVMQNSLTTSPSNEQVSMGKLLSRDKSNGSLQEAIAVNTNIDASNFNRTKYFLNFFNHHLTDFKSCKFK